MPTPHNALPTTLPFKRLSAFYFCYFATLGALLPYWALYLQGRGFDAIEIGSLMAVLGGTKIVAPNLWAWLSQRFEHRPHHRVETIRLAALLALVAFSTLYLAEGFWSMALVMFGYSFFWNAMLPQAESVTMNHLGPASRHYGAIRLWGSIGFIVTALSFGYLLRLHGAELLPHLLLGLFATLFLSSLLLTDRPHPDAHLPQEPLAHLLRRPSVLLLLLACLLMQASHGPYYTFFSIYLEGYGYSRELVGGLWAIGVIAEVLVFMRVAHWLPRYGALKLLTLAMAITSGRWILIALLPESLPSLLLAQSLHAASYGLYHTAAIHLIHRLFTGRNQVRGQALYSSLTFGLGGALGSWSAGICWEEIGSGATYLLAALLAGGGALIASRLRLEPKSGS